MSKALTGIFLGVFSIPKGLCMVIGGIRHRSSGSTAALRTSARPCSSSLWKVSWGQGCPQVWGIPPGWVPTPCPVPAGVFAPTLFSKVYGKLVCGECHNVTQNPLGHYLCHNCHFDLVSGDLDPQQREFGVGNALSPPGSRAGWWQQGCPLSPVSLLTGALSADGQQWHSLLQPRPVSAHCGGDGAVPTLGWHLLGLVMFPHPSQGPSPPQ